MPRPESFEEFWPFYVSQHQDPTCRKLHFVGTTIAMGCLAAAPFNPWLALAAPVAGYGFAWVGHFVFEKNKPASWLGPKEFVWSLRGDLRMWKHTLLGTMNAEVERHGLAEVAS
ncbi:MAG: Mpo1-like protein [Kofleriaceae bacterium]